MAMMLRFLPAGLAAMMAALVLVPAGCTSDDGRSPIPGPSSFFGEARPAEADAYSHFLVARFAALTNDPVTAAKNYEAALAHDGAAEDDMAERAVFVALLAGDVEVATRMARAAGPDGAGAGLSRLTLAVDAIRRGRLREADTLLSEGGFGPFNRLVVDALHAWVLSETEGLAAARARLLASQSGDAVLDSVLYYQLAMIELAGGETEAALRSLEQVWSGGARLAVAAQAQARILAARGERSEAIALLDTFRSEIGINAGLEHLRGQIEAGGRIRLERPSLREGAALAIYAPAAALAAQTEGDLAGVYFALSLVLDPDLHVARTLWAQALDEADRREAAIALLSGVPESSRFFATARGQMAWALRREGRDEAALEVAAEALAAQPDRSLKIQLGDLYRSLGRDGQAEQVFTELIESDAGAGVEDWRLLFARGAARERLGRWPEAEGDLTRALALNPDEPALLNYLGYSWVDRGLNLDRALGMIERAVRLRPLSGAIIDSLGWAHYRMGNYDIAVRLLERAVELEPADPVLNDHLGDAYWKVGRRLEARFQWQRVLQLDPDAREAEAAAAKLADGLPLAGPDLARTETGLGPAVPPRP